MATKEKSCNLFTSHFLLSLEDLLTIAKGYIISLGKSKNINAQGIAGAITWEYEQNKWKGRMTDYFQYFFPGSNSGLGWGSIHTSKARQIRPDLTDSELTCVRMEALPAIEMVATIMKNAADDYFRISNGIWINESAPLLALFFNSSDELLKKSAENRRLNSRHYDRQVQIPLSPNQMGMWVRTNLFRFTDFLTIPTPPSTCYTRGVEQ